MLKLTKKTNLTQHSGPREAFPAVVQWLREKIALYSAVLPRFFCIVLAFVVSFLILNKVGLD